jgi:antitoxin component of MazEF toxin-antitoxin module
MKKINVRGEGKLKSGAILKVRKIGECHYILLPKPFCTANNINPGDPVAVATAKNVLTMVFPPVAQDGHL